MEAPPCGGEDGDGATSLRGGDGEGAALAALPGPGGGLGASSGSPGIASHPGLVPKAQPGFTSPHTPRIVSCVPSRPPPTTPNPPPQGGKEEGKSFPPPPQPHPRPVPPHPVPSGDRNRARPVLSGTGPIRGEGGPP